MSRRQELSARSCISSSSAISTDHVEAEVARGEYYDGAREYRAYRDLMRKEGAVNFRNEKPVRFEDSAQFLRLGLMRTEEALEQSARMTQDARAAEPAAHRA